MQARRPAEIVRHVVFGGPDQLPRHIGHGLRDCDRLADEVALQPATETAADELGVHAYLSRLDARDLGRDGLCAGWELRACPHVDTAPGNARQAIRRLERCV